ncbi:unnamed protein product [Prunus armeniaca]|uniref:Uncharacterized protein n=1 Tax=Prunus armeniaca TaxID=36596 RepID=A0A6J5X8R8_PRUAR|nr:unnamed protein product [Prunus armeniaca]CAB4308917.1 unnamed protein product [Prunus armeniaca]
MGHPKRETEGERESKRKREREEDEWSSSPERSGRRLQWFVDESTASDYDEGTEALIRLNEALVTLSIFTQ